MSQEIINNLIEGLKITGLGLLGVFGVLIIFYFMVLLLYKLPEDQPEEGND